MEECDQKQIQLFIEKITSHDKNYSEIFASMKTIKVLIGKQPSLYQKLITNERNEVLNTANKMVSDYFIEHEKLVSVEEIVVLLQFLHNMCVGQQDFCNEMWSRMEGLFIKLLNIDGEVKLKNVLAAIILQLLKHNCAPLNNTELMVNILKGVLNTIMVDDSIHFPLIVIQELIRNQPEFSFDLAYEHLNLQQKLILLDIIAEEKIEKMPVQLVKFLASTFKKQSAILMTVMKQESVTNPSETIRILKLIGTFSHSNEFIHVLQSDKSLVIDAVYLLRMVHDSGKSNPNHMFSVVKNMTEVSNIEKMESDPVFGFKRDLIRLIGNLCHENRENQDQVREINGIELLLDCSPIDGKNPYISQWVIFAIRNICLGNQENQAVLNSVSKNGTTDKQMLEEIGVQLQGM